MARSVKKATAEGPEFNVTVHFMDDGSVRFTLPNGPWVIDSSFTMGTQPSQIRVSRKGTTAGATSPDEG